MNIAIINAVGKSMSTGKISYSLYKYLKSCGHNTIICYGRKDDGVLPGENDCYRINNNFQLFSDVAKAKLLNNEGFNALGATKNLIKILIKHHIEAVYLLNIHDHFINQPLLFSYFEKNNIKVIYLMIDEYAYLGSCCYPNECEQFKIGCNSCPPETLTYFEKLHNHPSRIYNIKKSAYLKLNKQLIFVGIQYVVDRAKRSAAVPADANFAVIDEAVDLRNMYYPRDTTSLKKKLKIDDKKVIAILVAPFNNPRKGAVYFRQAAKLMENNDSVVFVHVGYNGKIEDCPKNYIPISYVSDQNELAEYYSLGDVFVCTSLAETIPATCLEALSCGTPLIGFNISGTPYCADSEHGTFVEAKNPKALVDAIMKVPKKTKDRIDSCRKYAKSRFDAAMYNEKLEKLLY